MMNEGQSYIYTAWWLITLPGLLISITLMAINVTSEWMSTARGGENTVAPSELQVASSKKEDR